LPHAFDPAARENTQAIWCSQGIIIAIPLTARILHTWPHVLAGGDCTGMSPFGMLPKIRWEQEPTFLRLSNVARPDFCLSLWAQDYQQHRGEAKPANPTQIHEP